MSVDDHGLEAIRKSAEEITAGNKAEYRLKTISTTAGLGAGGGLVTVVALNSSTWTALPSTAATNRKAVAIQNRSGIDIKVNYSSGVAGYVGMTIPDGGERFYDMSSAVTIYGKSASGTPSVNVEELG